MPRFAILDGRMPIAVSGPDRVEFLQGLVSTDVNKLSPSRALYGAFLTAQGKYLHDFFVAALGERIVLDCEAGRRDDLQRRLSMYRLRSKVTVAPEDGLAVAVLFGDGTLETLDLPDEPGAARELEGGLVYADPRLAAAGARAIISAAGAPASLEALGFAPADAADYDAHRLALGLPDGSRDMEVEKATLLESGFHELNGVDWKKGCFVGQELTARTYYRGLVKKRLLPVHIDGPAPAPGTAIEGGGRTVGEMRSSAGDAGLALLRLDALDGAARAPLTAGDARLAPEVPDWVVLHPKP